MIVLEGDPPLYNTFVTTPFTHWQAKVDNCVQRQKQIQEQLKSMSDQVQELQPLYARSKEELNEKKKVTRNSQNELKKEESYLRKVLKDRTLLNEKIKEMQRRLGMGIYYV